MNSQLHISVEQIEILDRLSNCDVLQYKKLLNFAEKVSIDRIKHRVNQFHLLTTLLPEKKLIEFDTFLDLESYILENHVMLILASKDISIYYQHDNSIKKITPILNELFVKHVPELTGSNKDKIISMMKNHKEVQYHPYYLKNLLVQLKTWYTETKIFRFFGFEIEQLATLKDFENLISQTNRLKRVHEFYKKIKPELAKNILDKKDFLIKISTLKHNVDFYMPVIEQSHKYDNFELFFSHLVGMEVKLKVKEVFDIMEKEKINLIHYNADQLTLIAHIESYNQIEKIGAKSWCLTNHISDWTRYTSNYYFVICWVFSKEHTLESEMYGICLDQKDLTIKTCQNRNNNHVDLKWKSGELKDISEYFNSYKKNIHNALKTKPLTKQSFDLIHFAPPLPPPPPPIVPRTNPDEFLFNTPPRLYSNDMELAMEVNRQILNTKRKKFLGIF